MMTTHPASIILLGVVTDMEADSATDLCMARVQNMTYLPQEST